MAWTAAGSANAPKLRAMRDTIACAAKKSTAVTAAETNVRPILSTEMPAASARSTARFVTRATPISRIG